MGERPIWFISLHESEAICVYVNSILYVNQIWFSASNSSHHDCNFSVLCVYIVAITFGYRHKYKDNRLIRFHHGPRHKTHPALHFRHQSHQSHAAHAARDYDLLLEEQEIQ